MAMQPIRQPRVADIVASRLRDDILSGRLKEGDVLPSQESLFAEFGVSPPAVREAIHLLETDGLISVRRGNVGGAVVNLPTAERTAHVISMVLQARTATPADVSEALMHLEPICAGMCAARDDRISEVGLTFRPKSTPRPSSSTMCPSMCRMPGGSMKRSSPDAATRR
jgi:GntR family transcriptional repressor for pyruvate dehydrogenase complex